MTWMNSSVKQTDSWTQRTDWCLPRWEMGEGWIGSLGLADANYCIHVQQSAVYEKPTHVIT